MVEDESVIRTALRRLLERNGYDISEAGSVQEAFGVQTDIEVKSMPKGTSIIAREFSPGRPEPTPMNTIRQFTVNSNMSTLDVQVSERAMYLDTRGSRSRLSAPIKWSTTPTS